MDDTIRAILAEQARLSVDAAQLDDDTDLYRVGLTSHGTVNVMLALEDAFDVEVPEDLMRKSTFQSIASMRAVIESLTGHAACRRCSRDREHVTLEGPVLGGGPVRDTDLLIVERHGHRERPRLRGVPEITPVDRLMRSPGVASPATCRADFPPSLPA